MAVSGIGMGGGTAGMSGMSGGMSGCSMGSHDNGSANAAQKVSTANSAAASSVAQQGVGGKINIQV